MAQNVVINGVTYESVPEVDIPVSGGGSAKFMDTSDANAAAADIRTGKSGYVNGVKVAGSMAEKAAATYTPGTSDQTIAADQYLTGAQTVKGDANLQAANILKDVTIFGVTGALALPSISQDSTTKVLSIA